MKEKLGWVLFLVASLLSFVCSYWLSQKLHISVEVWQQFGYGGIFLGSLVVNATVFFSIPFALLPFAVTLAEQTHPLPLGIFYVGIAYAAGAAFGESTGYLLGYLTGGPFRRRMGMVTSNKNLQTAGRMSGLGKVSTAIRNGGESLYGKAGEKIGFKQKIPRWLDKYGGWIIIPLAFIPSPFDFLGLLLGTMRYPWWKFCILTFIGRVPKYCLAILLLHFGIDIIFH